jgi:predicted amidophosphoribosyltransferase
MSLKLVLISPSGSLVDSEKRLHTEHVDQMCQVISRLGEQGIRVAIWSNHRWRLKDGTGLADFFSQRSGVQVDAVGSATTGFPARRRSGSVDPILRKYDVLKREVILVGNGEEDVLAGVNNKLLLVRPNWYPTTSEYGFLVESIAEFERFCVIFGLRKHPIYWAVNTGKLNVYAMGPYSTRITEYATFGTDAVQSAKHEKGTLNFWHQLIVSTLYFSGLIEKVDYIATYPGHSVGEKNRVIDQVMSQLGKCFRKTFYPDLIVRHTTAVKSAYATPEQKTYKNQLATIKLNRRPKKYGVEPRHSNISLGNKTVLVVDDICTNGRSLESARFFIESAGGKTILFSWLKTINTNYLEIDSRPTINPFMSNNIEAEPATKPHGYHQQIVEQEAASEIASLLDFYNSWKT